MPPDNTPADPWSQQPAAPAPRRRRHSATGARKLRKKLAADRHHAGERASRREQGQGEGQGEARQEKVERVTADEPRGPRRRRRACDDAAGVAIPAAHDVSPAAARARSEVAEGRGEDDGDARAFSPRGAGRDGRRRRVPSFDEMDADDGELSAGDLRGALFQ